MTTLYKWYCKKGREYNGFQREFLLPPPVTLHPPILFCSTSIFAAPNFFDLPMRFLRNEMFVFWRKNIESGCCDDLQMGNIPKTQEHIVCVYQSSNIIAPKRRFRIIAHVYRSSGVESKLAWFRSKLAWVSKLGSELEYYHPEEAVSNQSLRVSWQPFPFYNYLLFTILNTCSVIFGARNIWHHHWVNILLEPIIF